MRWIDRAFAIFRSRARTTQAEDADEMIWDFIAPGPDPDLAARIERGLERADQLGRASGHRLTGDDLHDLTLLQSIADGRPPEGDLDAIAIYLAELLRRRFDGRWCQLRAEREEGPPAPGVGWVLGDRGDRPRRISAVAATWRPDAEGQLPLGPIFSRVVHEQQALERQTAGERAERSITMKDLIEAGLLTPGQRLELAIKDNLPGTVRRDGRLEVSGTVYDDPTASVEALVGLPVNYGWGPWRAPQPDGSRPSLDDLRHELAQRRSNPVISGQ